MAKNNDMLKYGDGKNKNPQKTLKYTPKDTKMRTTYITEKGNEYPIWKDANTGQYYIIDKTGKRSNFSNQKAINLINQNKLMCISKASYGAGKFSNKSGTPIDAGGNGGGGGGYSGGGGGGGYYDPYEPDIAALRQQLEELIHPKVWTADELAALYGVTDQYNMDNILKQYNDATNKYYTDAIASQEEINADAERNNSAYASSLLRNYINGYANSAPTAVGKGTLAANALSTQLGADKANEEASANFNSIINSYNQAWKDELAQNNVKARSDYNALGTWLLNQGTALNAAQVQNYINELTALDTAYTGIRNAQNNLASTAAAAYQQNANAALTANQYNASQAKDNMLRKAYELYYGPGWEKAYNNAKQDVSQYNLQSSSKN